MERPLLYVIAVRQRYDRTVEAIAAWDDARNGRIGLRTVPIYGGVLVEVRIP